jgi:dihydrofolate synthase/folylpolyglutamate synthase
MTPTYDEALRRFHERSDFEKGSITNPFGRDGSEGERGLARVHGLLDQLGNPHQAVPVVHVAGSKGKGSTVAFLSTILTAAGLRTGRYVSPHLHTLRERIAIDGEPMTEADFVAGLDTVLAAAEMLEATRPELGRVTAFEISTAMAFEQFARSGCDIAVIEVGLGGTWDATNVVDPAVSVIALLDYEHTDVLGDTMTEIARNKAGIIKPGRPVVTLAQPDEGMAVIREVSAGLDAPLFIEGEAWRIAGDWRHARFADELGEIGPVRLGLTGPHQVRNAGLAFKTARLLRGWSISDAAIADGLASTVWPARFEILKRPGKPDIVIDGAHTAASARALVETLDEEYPGAPVQWIFGMLGAKNAAGMLAELSRRSDHVILVRPANPRAMSMAAMQTAADAAGLRYQGAATVAMAIETAEKRADASGVIVVTGSLSFAAEARVTLGLATSESLPAPTPGA